MYELPFLQDKSGIFFRFYFKLGNEVIFPILLFSIEINDSSFIDECRYFFTYKWSNDAVNCAFLSAWVVRSLYSFRVRPINEDPDIGFLADPPCFKVLVTLIFYMLASFVK